MLLLEAMKQLKTSPIGILQHEQLQDFERNAALERDWFEYPALAAALLTLSQAALEQGPTVAWTE